jgi:hypothetical protein
MEFAVVPPLARIAHHVGSMKHRRGWNQGIRLVGTRSCGAGQHAYGATGRPNHYRQTIGDVGAGLLDGSNQTLEMMGKPEIVVAQISDVASASHREAGIVRRSLITAVPRQVVPAYSCISKRCRHGFRIVRASVADHQQLEILKGLSERAPDGAAQHTAVIVGGDDDANQRRQISAHADRYQPLRSSKR